jgi:hypothetical protein
MVMVPETTVPVTLMVVVTEMPEPPLAYTGVTPNMHAMLSATSADAVDLFAATVG